MIEEVAGLLKLVGEIIKDYIDDPTHRLLAREKIQIHLTELKEKILIETDKEKIDKLLADFTDLLTVK